MSARTGRASTPAGFTAIELVVVLLIASVATALAVPAFRAWFAEDDMTVATRRIEALFRVARDSALRSGNPVTVVIDSASGFVWLDAPIPDEDTLDDAEGAGAAGLFGWSREDRSMAGSSIRPAAAGESSGAESIGESLALPSTVRLELTRARARFTIAPGGHAFADTLRLRTTLEERWITLDPWTADVRAY